MERGGGGVGEGRSESGIGDGGWTRKFYEFYTVGTKRLCRGKGGDCRSNGVTERPS